VAKYSTGINADETLPCQDLDQLFVLGQPGNHVNLFFVDDLTSSTGSSVGHLAGLDGAIPGPSGFSGTIKSGAVMNISDLAQGTHECGGAENLMFWLLDATSRGKLSPEQSDTMRRNPAVQ